MNYALVLSYRGDRYAGWQRQANAPTVQQAVEKALAELLSKPVQVHGASRTDAGVHARGQVAHLVLERDFPVGGLQHGGNHHLPEDIRILAARRMPDGFDARKHAIAKEYRYRLIQERVLSPIDAPFAVRSPPRLDVAALCEAAELLVGRHDFTAFALSGGGHHQPFRRIFEAKWVDDGYNLEFRVVGDGFLRGMVRSIVGTLLDVGTGRIDVDRFGRLLEGRSRSQAGPTAPARGLILHRVEYPEEWNPAA